MFTIHIPVKSTRVSKKVWHKMLYSIARDIAINQKEKLAKSATSKNSDKRI